MELIEKRKKLKLTQEQVAESLKISRSYYTQIENGDRRPSPEVAKRIAEVFGFENEWYKLLESDKPA